jgi:hypothetical protein
MYLMPSEIYWDANFVHRPKTPKTLRVPMQETPSPQLNKPRKPEAGKPPKHLDGFEQQSRTGSIFEAKPPKQ